MAKPQECDWGARFAIGDLIGEKGGMSGSKSGRVEEILAAHGVAAGKWDPRYAAYFACFNAGEYYAAHDVLEDLWLGEPGGLGAYYKGLIQVAGAFEHVKKQRARPWHGKDGRRLAPASRLFRSAERYLGGYGATVEGVDLAGVRRLCLGWADRLEAGRFEVNPWDPGALPRIELQSD
jgi:hypothetical protein